MTYTTTIIVTVTDGKTGVVTRSITDDAMPIVLPKPEDSQRRHAQISPASSYQPGTSATTARAFFVDWPRIGGRGFTAAHTDAFMREAFRDRWRPGESRAIYAAGCAGLGQIVKQLRVPIYKVSTCGADRVWRRMDELNTDRYGSMWQSTDGYVCDREGFDDWFPSQLHPELGPSPGSPVHCTERAIVVQLPEGMSRQTFDKAFDAETAKGALNTWLSTQPARDHCTMVGFDPAQGRRFTNYVAGHGRPSPAMEICGFTLNGGPDRIISLAERIILAHLSIDG